MTEKRYENISTEEHRRWYPDAPFQIKRSQLLYDKLTQTKILRIRAKNLASSEISFLDTEIVCYDDAGNYLTEEKNVIIEGEGALPHTEFGANQTIELSNAQTSKVEIKVLEAVFTDGTIWRSAGFVEPLELIEPIKFTPEDSDYQFLLEESKSAGVILENRFYECSDYWICTCGQANRPSRETCTDCKTAKDWYATHFNEEYLQQKVAENEEKERQQALDAEIEQQKKARNKKTVTVTLILLLLLGLSWMIYQGVYLPDKKYKEAEAHFRGARYENAAEIFEELGEYKDSKTKAKDAYYRNAVQQYDQKNYNLAAEGFAQLGDYQQSQLFHLEARFELAKELHENKLHQDAIEILQELKNSSNNETIISNTKYNRILSDNQNRPRDLCAELILLLEPNSNLRKLKLGKLRTGWQKSLSEKDNILIYSDGGKYVGEQKDGKLHGKGTLYFSDGDVYKGGFSNDLFHGRGTFSWENGEKYTGQHVKGERQGEGTYTWPDGKEYSGAWLAGERTGWGSMSWPSGYSYVGDFLNGELTGWGMHYYNNGDFYHGELINGNRHGYGTYYWANGNSRSGFWSDNDFLRYDY